jgi:hypothetical protein
MTVGIQRIMTRHDRPGRFAMRPFGFDSSSRFFHHADEAEKKSNAVAMSFTPTLYHK